MLWRSLLSWKTVSAVRWRRSCKPWEPPVRVMMTLCATGCIAERLQARFFRKDFLNLNPGSSLQIDPFLISLHPALLPLRGWIVRSACELYQWLSCPPFSPFWANREAKREAQKGEKNRREVQLSSLFPGPLPAVAMATKVSVPERWSFPYSSAP